MPSGSIIAAFAAAFCIALSFLTTLPAPRPDWTPERLRFFPAVMPLTGLVVGLLGAAAFCLLTRWAASVVLRSCLMALFYLAVTGGLHMDGLMDTCDAVFSRRDRETRLEILSDTHAGAFAVMGCAAVLLLKMGIFSELFTWKSLPVTELALIPALSRAGMGWLFYAPFAKKDGLARMLGSSRISRDRFLLIALYVSLSLPFAIGSRWIVPCAGAALAGVWLVCCRRTFGGITGDLLGAYLELSESLMFLALTLMPGAAR